MMTKTLVLCAIGLSALTAAPSAKANDAKSYVGSQCSWQGTTAADRNNHALRNGTAGSLVSTCPIIKETMTANIEYASAHVSSSVDSCRLEERTPDNSLLGWNHTSIVPTAFGRRFEWFAGAGTGNPVDSAALTIECTMPAGASIYYYYLEET